MKIEMLEKLKAVTPKDIEELKKKLGVDIPKEYTDFLMLNSGGQPLHNMFKKYDENGKLFFEFPVNVFFGIDNECDIYRTKVLFADRIPSDLLPIGDDGVGDIICLGLGQNNYGKVFIWNDNERPLNEPISYRDIELLAESFEEFVKGLGPE